MLFRDYIFKFKFILVDIEKLWRRKCKNTIFTVTPSLCYFIPLFSGLAYLYAELSFKIQAYGGWTWYVRQRGAQST